MGNSTLSQNPSTSPHNASSYLLFTLCAIIYRVALLFLCLVYIYNTPTTELELPNKFPSKCLSRTSTHSLKSTISRPSVSKLQDMRQLKARRSLADILYPSTNSKNDRPKASKPFS